MVEAPARSKEPSRSGAPLRPTGLTRSRSLSRGVLLMGLAVLTRLPAVEGGTTPEPVGDGVKLGPATGTTWLLVMSTCMSRIEDSLLRCHCGQRRLTSKSFSPSIMDVRDLPPTALWTRLLTSAALTP